SGPTVRRAGKRGIAVRRLPAARDAEACESGTADNPRAPTRTENQPPREMRALLPRGKQATEQALPPLHRTGHTWGGLRAGLPPGHARAPPGRGVQELPPERSRAR